MRFLIVLSLLISYTAWKVHDVFINSVLLSVLFSVAIFLLMIGWQVIVKRHPSVYPHLWFQFLAWSGTLLLGFWATFTLLSLPFDLIRLLFPFPHFSQQLSIWLLVISFVLSILGFLQVLRGPVVKTIELDKKNLHHDLQGLKMVQISDLHIGPTIRARTVRDVVEKVNRLNADFIFITGDLADGTPRYLPLSDLKNLKSRFGVFYVTGNHEYYWNALELIKYLNEFEFHILINQNEVVSVGQAQIMIAGITDPAGGLFLPDHHPNLNAAASNTNAEIDLRILLAHRPGVFEQAERLKFDLQFSGHTHAGQFFPFSLLIPFAHRYYSGLHQFKNLSLYVNPGTGYWGPAHRFTVSSEITQMILK